MEPCQDYKELFESLNENGVEFLIVGAHALAFHGVPRFTGDIDILLRPDTDNAERTIRALRAFGFEFSNLNADDFDHPDSVVQLGVPPVRVDLMTSITGVSWEEAERNRVAAEYDGVPVHYLGRDQCIANKRATGRTKDLADLEAMGEC